MEDPIVGDWNLGWPLCRLSTWRDHDRNAARLRYRRDGRHRIRLRTEFRNHDIRSAVRRRKTKNTSRLPVQRRGVRIACAIATLYSSAEVIQEQLAKIGLKTVIKQMDPPSMGA